MKRVLEELRKQDRSLRWLARNVGVHYQTAIRWKDSGIPRWHHNNIAQILNKPKEDLFE
jgi:hypothetical protein